MAMDLAALEQLINAQAGAQQNLGGLEDSLSQARALRGGSIAPQAQTGYVDPFSAIASMIEGSRARKTIRETTPQLEAAQLAIGQGQAAQKMYGLQKALDKEATRVSERRETESTRVGERAEDLALEAAERKTVERINPVSKKVETLTEGNGVFYKDGKPVENQHAWIEKEKALSSHKGPASFARPSRIQQDDLESMGLEAPELNLLVSDFIDDYGNTSGIPFKGSLSNLASRVAPGQMSDEAKASQAWWARYDTMYTLPVRNKLFGGALTASEGKEWEKAAISPNMEPEQIRKNLAILNRLKNKAARKMAENALLKNWNEPWIRSNLSDYMDAPLTDTPDKVEVDLTVVPEGVDRKEWALLSKDEKQDYHDFGAG